MPMGSVTHNARVVTCLLLFFPSCDLLSIYALLFSTHSVNLKSVHIVHPHFIRFSFIFVFSLYFNSSPSSSSSSLCSFRWSRHFFNRIVFLQITTIYFCIYATLRIRDSLYMNRLRVHATWTYILSNRYFWGKKKILAA